MTDHHDFSEPDDPVPFDEQHFSWDDHIRHPDLFDTHHEPELSHDPGIAPEPGLAHDAVLDNGDPHVAGLTHESAGDHSAVDHSAVDHSAVDHSAVDHESAVDDLTHEHDAAPDESVFPPMLDVGHVPEPVDGFPWIDVNSLGVIEPVGLHQHLDPVQAVELAESAHIDLPAGVDPWTVLVDSDDPAISALARWWSTHAN